MPAIAKIRNKSGKELPIDIKNGLVKCSFSSNFETGIRNLIAASFTMFLYHKDTGKLKDLCETTFTTIQPSMSEETFQELQPENLWNVIVQMDAQKHEFLEPISISDKMYTFAAGKNQQYLDWTLLDKMIVFWGEFCPERIEELPIYKKEESVREYAKLCLARGAKPFTREKLEKSVTEKEDIIPDLTDIVKWRREAGEISVEDEAGFNELLEDIRKSLTVAR